MIILKILLLPVVLILIAQVWSEFRRSRLGVFWSIFWLFAWFSVGVILFFPQITNYLAGLLGIGRGIDVIVYLCIISLFYLVFRLYLRSSDLERKISQLAQEISLNDE